MKIKPTFFVLLPIIFLIGFIYIFTLNYTKEDLNNDKYSKEIENEVSELFNNHNFDEAIGILSWYYSEHSLNKKIVADYASVLLYKGSVNYSEEEHALKSLNILNEYLKNNKWDSEIYRLKWYSYEIIENYEKALEFYNKSLEIDSNNFNTLWNIWHSYRLMWDYENAIYYFKKALNINNNYFFSSLNIWQLYMLMWNYERAEEYLLKAYDDVNNNIRFKSDITYSLWSLYLEKKSYEKAEKYLSMCYEFDPAFDSANLWLWKLYLFKSIKNLDDKDTEFLWKNVDNAHRYLINTININPNKTMWYYYLAMYYKFFAKNIEEKGNYSILLKKALDVVHNDITLSSSEKNNFSKIIQEKINNIDIKNK